jgi:hypothetical protein
MTWHDAGILLVCDELSSKSAVEGVSRIHLHPECEIVQLKDDSVELRSAVGPFFIKFAGNGMLQVEPAFYCPEFGLRLPNKALAWSSQGAAIQFAYSIALGKQVDAFDLKQGATLNGKVYEI